MTHATQTAGARLRVLWRGSAGGALRFMLALLPLSVIAHRVRLSDLLGHMRHVGATTMGSSLVLLLISTAVGVLRWRTLLRAYGVTAIPPLGTLARHYFVAIYFSLLPSGLAGDAARLHRVRDAVPDLAIGLTVVASERAAGLLGLCIVAGAAMAADGRSLGAGSARVLIVGVLGGLGLSITILAAPWGLARWRRLRVLVERVPLLGVAALRLPVARSPLGFLGAVALSVVTQAFAVLSIALLILPLAPAVTLLACLKVIPVIVLAMFVPVTPAGIGQRELAFQLCLGTIGVSATASLAASLVYGALGMCLAGIGGACLLGEQFDRARSARR